MTIGIDITPLLFEGSGVAKYTYNLVKNLLLLDKKNQYKLFFVSQKSKKNFPFLKEFEALGAKIYYFKIPFNLLMFFWQKLDIFPIEWFIGKIDLFYANDFLRSPSKIKTLTTVHDLTWKLYPNYHTQMIIDAHQKKIEKTIKYGDLIIVDSKNTKKDLLKLYPQIDKDKVEVIYPGIGEEFKKIMDKKKVEKGLKKYLNLNFSLSTFNFLLYVGAIEPRKNLDIAIKVFHRLITAKPKPIPYKDLYFLIVGKAGWKNEKIFKLVKDLKLEDKVIFIGYVDDCDLPAIYSSAKLTFYLSSYEGFGLPPLESLSCGTPVIAGKNSSMKETLPNEFLVYEKNEKEVYKKAINFLSNPPKINFKKIKEKFSWNIAVKNLKEIIEKIT